MIAGVIARAGSVGAARGDAEVGDRRLEITAIAVRSRRGRRRPLAVESGAGDLGVAARADAGLQRLRARVEVDICRRRCESFRRGVFKRADVGRYSRCTGEMRAICTASSAMRFRASAPASLPVLAPRRPNPDRCGNVEIVGAPAGGDAVVGKARVRFDGALQRYLRIVGTRGLRVRQYGFADLQAVVACQHHSAAVFKR